MKEERLRAWVTIGAIDVCDRHPGPGIPPLSRYSTPDQGFHHGPGIPPRARPEIPPRTREWFHPGPNQVFHPGPGIPPQTRYSTPDQVFHPGPEIPPRTRDSTPDQGFHPGPDQGFRPGPDQGFHCSISNCGSASEFQQKCLYGSHGGGGEFGTFHERRLSYSEAEGGDRKARSEFS